MAAGKVAQDGIGSARLLLLRRAVVNPPPVGVTLSDGLTSHGGQHSGKAGDPSTDFLRVCWVVPRNTADVPVCLEECGQEWMQGGSHCFDLGLVGYGSFRGHQVLNGD